MLGDIWDTITDAVGTAWEQVLEIPSMLGGMFGG